MACLGTTYRSNNNNTTITMKDKVGWGLTMHSCAWHSAEHFMYFIYLNIHLNSMWWILTGVPFYNKQNPKFRQEELLAKLSVTGLLPQKADSKMEMSTHQVFRDQRLGINSQGREVKEARWVKSFTECRPLQEKDRTLSKVAFFDWDSLWRGVTAESILPLAATEQVSPSCPEHDLDMLQRSLMALMATWVYCSKVLKKKCFS